jgi:hypothetical protein
MLAPPRGFAFRPCLERQDEADGGSHYVHVKAQADRDARSAAGIARLFYRNRGLHRAYLLFAGLYVPLTAGVYSVWETPWWHATAHQIMGV